MHQPVFKRYELKYLTVRIGFAGCCEADFLRFALNLNIKNLNKNQSKLLQKSHLYSIITMIK